MRLVVAAALTAMALFAAPALAQERTISFHNMHTGEDLTVVYKRDGRYVSAAMEQINFILRDWRRNEVIEMDPRLIDLAWEVVQRTGGQGVIQIVCGYRAPATNSMLRANSGGVAENSQHMYGNALDFFLSGVELADLRAAGLTMQVGGVGYYPTSGWPFVHLDTGSVRMWPRMSTAQLRQVFPEGRSLYIPDSGTPLPGYTEAQRAYEQRGQIVTALFQEPVAESGSSASGGFGTRIASLIGRDEPADQAGQAAISQAVSGAPASTPPVPIPLPADPVRLEPGIQLAAAPVPLPNPASLQRSSAQPSFTDPFVLAFADAPGLATDPLALLTEARPAPMPVAAPSRAVAAAAESRPAAAAPEIRRWSDPLAHLSGGRPLDESSLPLLDSGVTTRQDAFAAMQAPNTYDAPEFLLDPQRAMAGGFESGPPTLRTTRFTAGDPPTVAFVDLTRPAVSVAAR